MALGHLAWATVTIEAREHAAALRRLLGPYAGQLAVIGTGTHRRWRAIDRLLAGLAALEGDHDSADALFAAALAQERRRRIGAARRPHPALVGPRPPAPWRSGRRRPRCWPTSRATADELAMAGCWRSSTPSASSR